MNIAISIALGIFLTPLAHAEKINIDTKRLTQEMKTIQKEHLPRQKKNAQKGAFRGDLALEEFSSKEILDLQELYLQEDSVSSKASGRKRQPPSREAPKRRRQR